MAHSSEIEKLERRWMDNPMGVTFAPLAEAYRRAGDQARALEVLAIGLAQHPAYVPALIVQARCHLDAGADAPAEESFLHVLSSDPHNLIALKGLADICERTERLEEAQRHLARLLEADPTHDEGRIQHDRVAVLLAERRSIVAAAPPPAPEMPTQVQAVPDDFEPTVVHLDDEPPALASLVEPEPAQAGATTAGSDVLGMEIERETGPFGDFSPEEWTGMPLSGIQAPDLPFEEELTVPSLLEEPAPEATEPPMASEGRLERVEATAEPLAASAGPSEITEIRIEDPASAHLESPVIQVEAVTDRAASIDVGAPPADPEVLGLEIELEDDPISAEAEGWEPVRSDHWAASLTLHDPEPAEGVAKGSAPAPSGATEAPLAPVAGDLAAVGEGEDIAAPDDGEDVAPWMRYAESVPTAELEAMPAAGGGERVPAQAELEGARSEGDSDLDVVVVAGAEAEADLDEPEAELANEPELVVTETMAEIFLRQGHKPLALAVYAQLAERDPGNPRLVAAMERLREELSPRSPRATYSAAETGGESVGTFLARVLAVEPPPAPSRMPPPAIEPATAGAPTRPAADSLSLAAVFGEEPPGRTQVMAQPGGPEGGEESGPSFDEFFGGLANGSGPHAVGHGAPGDEQDLEQFNAWLRGLKR